MVRVFLLIFCLFCIKQEEPVLSWSNAYKLSWADFKAPPNTNTSAAAVTASGITFGFSITQTDKNQVVSYTTDVQAHFYPEQSWYKKELADLHVLGHEQLHFDITELFARKFRQRISGLKVSNTIKKELNRIHNEVNKELEETQNNYDTETDYSRNVEAQAKWKTFVETELKKLSKYKLVH